MSNAAISVDDVLEVTKSSCSQFEGAFMCFLNVRQFYLPVHEGSIGVRNGSLHNFGNVQQMSCVIKFLVHTASGLRSVLCAFASFCFGTFSTFNVLLLFHQWRENIYAKTILLRSFIQTLK